MTLLMSHHTIKYLSFTDSQCHIMNNATIIQHIYNFYTVFQKTCDHMFDDKLI